MKWNEKVKKTAERLGLSVEAFVEQHADWAQELQNEGAQAPAPAPAETGTVSLESYRALESSVVGLRSTVETLTTQLQNERRDGIAITALEAAKLPSSGKIQDGDTEIDLDASFRAELIDVARSAESDDRARESVAAKIAQRRAIIGQRQSAEKRPTLPENRRANLPLGDNSREAKRGDAPTDGKDARQFEGTRRSAGLR